MGSTPSKNLRKSEIEVNFWHGQGGDIGHVSLYLLETSLYVSFWPAQRVDWRSSVTSVPSTTHTYQEDEGAEGRSPDEVLKVNLEVDTSAMEQFWATFKSERYSLTTCNCSDAVIRVLEAGNNDFFLASQAFPPTREPNRSWTNTDYFVWLRMKLADFRLQAIRRCTKR